MKLALMKMFTSALSAYGGYYSLADPNTEYPICVFDFPSQSSGNLEGANFEHDTETFRVQVSVFDDQSDCMRMLEQMSNLHSNVLLLRSNEGVLRLKYVGGTGPNFIDTEREWRCTADYMVTMVPSSEPSPEPSPEPTDPTDTTDP